MKKIIITLFLLIGTIAYGQTHGDVSLSKTADIKKHFTKDVCDKILTDTFTICYDFKRKESSRSKIRINYTGVSQFLIVEGIFSHRLDLNYHEPNFQKQKTNR